jgi:membrane protease YdiL (CAAX protease family)
MMKAGHSKLSIAIQSFLFLGGLLFFTWFSHGSRSSFLFSLSGLAVSAFVVSINIRSFRDVVPVFDLHKITRKTVLYMPVALLTGIFLGMLYRHYIHLPVFSARLTSFALPAAGIGMVEELIFRGFLQSHMRKINVPSSVLLATLAHTTYKLVLFMSLQSFFEINLIFLVIWTFISGLIFGIIKEYSGNVIYPISGHVIFDIIVYGGRTLTPWWVWL